MMVQNGDVHWDTSSVTKNHQQKQTIPSIKNSMGCFHCLGYLVGWVPKKLVTADQNEGQVKQCLEGPTGKLKWNKTHLDNKKPNQFKVRASNQTWKHLFKCSYSWVNKKLRWPFSAQNSNENQEIASRWLELVQASSPALGFRRVQTTAEGGMSPHSQCS